MVSRSRTRKWGGIAIGLALIPAAPSLEGRLRAQAASAPFAALRGAESAPADADSGKDLVKKAREALKAGDIATAEKLAKKAQGLKVAAPFWDNDSPDNILADVAAARGKSLPDGDPKTLVKLAREAMAANRFDEAQALASRANASNQRWTLFDDTPAKCLDDIQKGRAKSDKAESAQLLAEARKLYDQKKYDDAESLAYRAERLHGSYGPFELGDRPSKLLSQIQTARAKNRKANLPPAPTAVVQSSEKAKPVAGPVPPPAWPVQEKGINVVKSEAKSPVKPVSATEPAVSSAKTQAQRLMADGRSQMAAGRHAEARGKFLEAQKLGGDFMADEDNPVRCMNELMVAVNSQIAEMTKGAVASVDAAARRDQDNRLKRARQLAGEFGLDAKPIDDRIAQLQDAANASVADAAGHNLLEKARVELRQGQIEVARQLATEVFNGPYRAQGEAAALLRTIDAEEANSRSRAAVRSFEAGLAAYESKDFAAAMAIFDVVDAGQLPDQARSQMKLLGEVCRKKCAAIASVPAVEATPVVATTPPALVPATMTEAPPAAATPQASGERLVDQVKALQKVEFQRLREEGQKVQSESRKLFERGETDAALEILQGYMGRVKASALEPSDVNLLIRPVDQRLHQLTLVKAQKDSETRITGRKAKHDLQLGRDAIARDRKQEQVKDLLKQYDALVKEGKYAEARLVAAKAKTLEPEDPAIAALDTVSQVKFNENAAETAKKNRENMFVGAMNNAENPGPYVDSDKPLVIDPVQMKLANNRGKGVDTINLRTEVERDIQHKMSTTVDLNFDNAPLRQVIDDLRVMSGINIIPDVTALEEERISLDTPVTIRVDKIRLSSGLKLALAHLKLTYVIADDVVKVTTSARARGKLEQRVYRVADLVMPIEDYQQPNAMNLERALNRHIEQQGVHLNSGATPLNNRPFMLPGGSPAAATEQRLTTDPAGNAGGAQSFSQIAAPTTQKQTMHEMLMKLVQNTVAPQTWSDVGGAGTIQFMPIGMALVVNQTVDVQEQVADLLDALRRLQDVQVAIEIRMITLSETFFERIGLDFNVNLKTNRYTEQFEPQITTNQFAPPGQVNDFNPNRFIAGLSPAGSQAANPGGFTSDLDIPIRSSSFQYAIPPFAYPNNPGFNGGLSMGLAFLSDIQVYMFMEAAQGDRRMHVMQAPKLTMYNGQTGSISVQDQQFFVTNVGVVGFGGQIVFVPQNNPFPLGVEVTMQPVVSADRRFVRLNANVRLANLASTNVPLFPITTFITPVFEGGAQGQPIPFTQFVQQPALALVSIQTSVSIPDGGTVIMGGLKTLSEGRNEFGPPVLSKVPYVNRLFKNVGFGRESQSLLIMVTPRVIINAEEELKQTGYNSNPDQ